MWELFCYEMTDADLRETGKALARCPGSKTRRQMLQKLTWFSLFVIGIFAAVSLRLWADISRQGQLELGSYWLIGFLLLVFLWARGPQNAGQALAFSAQVQKRAAGLDPAAPEPSRVWLERANYVRRIGQRSVTAIPLASLRAAKPVRGGGVALLFNTGREDYLPARLFGPAFTREDFCRRLTAQAAEERKTPRTLDELMPAAADAGQPAVYRLRFTLNPEQLAGLLSLGCKKLYCTPRQLRQALLLSGILPALCLIPLLLAFGLFWGLAAALLLWGGMLLLTLGVSLLVVSPAAYRLRLRRGKLDRLLGPQIIEFTPEQVTVRRAAGWDTAGYSLYAQLLDTPDAWFLVSQNPAGLLPIPKEALPEAEHAAFAQFLRARLGGLS